MLKKKTKSVEPQAPVKKKKSVESRIDKLRARQAELKKGNGQYDTFIFKEGVIRMRPLQVPEDEEFAVKVTYIFLNKDLGGFVSPASFDEPCPALEMYKKLIKGDEDDKEMANKIKPKQRYFSPHIRYKDINGKEVDTEAGVKLAQLTKGQYDALIELYLDNEQGDFTDPVNGYDIKYKRTGSGQFDTEYTLMPCKTSPTPKAYRKIYDVQQMVRDLVPTYEKIEEMINKFFGLTPDADEEDEAPKKKVIKKRVIKKKTKKGGDI